MLKENKNIDLELKHYKKFNAEKAKVACFEGDFSGAICTYSKSDNSSFFLSKSVLSYTIQGEKFIMVNNHKFYLREGDLIYIPKNVITFTNISVDGDSYKSFNIELNNEELKNYLPITNQETMNLAFEPFVIYKNYEIKAIFDQFIDNDLKKNLAIGYRKLLNDLIAQLNPLLLYNQTKREINNVEMMLISNMIVKTIYEDLTIEQMAFYCHMSLATFKRKFKMVFGISPQKWILNNRLETAYFQLKTNNMNVTEVAYLTGFDNLSHFSYSFKKHFSISPSTILSEELI